MNDHGCKRISSFSRYYGLNFVLGIVTAILMLMNCNSINAELNDPVVITAVRREPELSATIVRHRHRRIREITNNKKDGLVTTPIQSHRRIREIHYDNKDTIHVIIPSLTKSRHVTSSNSTTATEETIELNGIEVTPTNSNVNKTSTDNDNNTTRNVFIVSMVLLVVLVVSLLVCLFMKRYKKKQTSKSFSSSKTMTENNDHDTDKTETDTIHQEVL
jgi:ATP-dependent Zn protease